MSTGEIAFLALAIGVLVTFVSLTVYGVAVASERPAEKPADKTVKAGARLATQAH